ncbi:helix-turn-helix transcriptional regulator [Rhodopila sp.]|uniref:helix-turn-helix transcriptional regulator n=1 Tax=Rhodopila sp. TaxID=2480087 RepID=UPI003D0D8FA2
MFQKPLNVLREDKAAETVGLSLRTMQRLRQDGGGPPFVKLTDRRVGYMESALQDWLQARTVGSTSAATVAKAAKSR